MSEDRLQQHKLGIFRNVEYLNLFKPLPYAESTFRHVFSSHVFEHLPRAKLALLLRELHRVLRPGGTMRVSVPDLTIMVKNYSEQDGDAFVNAIFEIDHANAKNRHHWMYNECSMRVILSAAGFTNITRCRYRQGKCPDLELLDNRPEHSLFMEADKPD